MVCTALRRSNFSRIYTFQSNLRLPREDPNEIDLDDSKQSISKIENDSMKRWSFPTKFDDYGVGSLKNHPSLTRFFPPHIVICNAISIQDCMSNLMKFISSNSNATCDEFVNHLCGSYQARNASELGIFIEPSNYSYIVQNLIDMSQSCEQRKLQAISSFFGQSSHVPSIVESKMRIEKKVLVQSLSLKPPVLNSVLHQPYDDVKNHFSKKSAFSPSFSAIKAFIESKFFNQEVAADSRSKKYMKTRTIDYDLFCSIAAEYFFLHFGSKRDISKRYCLAEETISVEPSPEALVSEEINKISSIEQESSVDLDEISKAKDSSNAIALEETCSIGIPFETKRFCSGYSLPSYLKEEADSLIWEISNHQLQEILEDIQIPPLPPSNTTSSFNTLSASVQKQEIVVTQQIGRIGECIVFQYLKRRFENRVSTTTKSPLYQVSWLNETEDNRAAYDLTIDPSSSIGGGRIFVEVKSSRFDENNVFQLSLWEWQFLTQLPVVNYHIYRVFSAQDRTKTRITVLTNVRRLVEMGRVQLCLNI